MENYVFSKKEIAKFLRDSYRTIEYCLSPKGRNVDFFNGYTHIVSADKKIKTYNEFDVTFAIFSFYLLLKKFVCSYEEGQYEIINDDLDVDGIIYVEPKPSNLSAKRIVTHFRNALSHNDNPNHELYRFIIKDDQLFLEIHLKEVKGGPFHVLLDVSTFYKIVRQIEKNKLLIMAELIDVDLDNINSHNCIKQLSKAKMRTYYSKKELSFKEKEDINKLYCGDKKTMFEISELYSEKFRIEDKDLELWQKIKFKEELIRFEKRNYPYDFSYILGQTQPSAKFKSDNVDKLIDIIVKAALQENKSYSEALIDLSTDDDYCDNTVSLYGLLDCDALIAIARSIYSSYIYDTLVLDKEVVIGDKKYDRERIRNSFTHMRWVNRSSWYRIFDWYDNRKENEKSDKDRNISFSKLLNANDFYYYDSLSEDKTIFNNDNDNMIFFTCDDVIRVGIKQNNILIYSDIDKKHLFKELEIFVMSNNEIRLANENEAFDYVSCMIENRDKQDDKLKKQIAYLIVKNTQKYIFDFLESDSNNKSQAELDVNKLR